MIRECCECGKQMEHPELIYHAPGGKFHCQLHYWVLRANEQDARRVDSERTLLILRADFRIALAGIRKAYNALDKPGGVEKAKAALDRVLVRHPSPVDLQPRPAWT